MRLGSALESTTPADSSLPSASSTCVARPFAVTIRSTSASQRISAPASRAASAISRVTSPMPPRTNPQVRTPPPDSSDAWSCSST